MSVTIPQYPPRRPVAVQPAGPAPPLPHDHAVEDLTNLDPILGTLALQAHGHDIADVDGLQTSLDAAAHSHPYAATVHGHAVSDVTGLQAGLDAKAGSTHNHDAAYAATAHSHAIANVTNLQTSLDAKAASVHSHTKAQVTDFAHAHPVGEVTASGTPGATTFLRGDGSWAAPAAPAPTFAVLATNATAMGLATTNTVKISPAATATFTTTVPAAGTECCIIFLTSGTVSRVITFGTGFKATGTLTTGTVTARVFVVGFISDGTNLYEQTRTIAMAA